MGWDMAEELLVLSALQSPSWEILFLNWKKVLKDFLLSLPKIIILTSLIIF